jgi:hypothetical protein
VVVWIIRKATKVGVDAFVAFLLRPKAITTYVSSEKRGGEL